MIDAPEIEIVEADLLPSGKDETIEFHRERLPESARAIWDDIEQATRESDGRQRANEDAKLRLRAARDTDRAELARWEKQLERSGLRATKREAIVLEKLEKRISDADSKLAKLTKNKFAPPANLAKIEDWAASLRLHWRFRPVSVPVKAADLLAASKKSRERYAKLKLDRDTLANGPLTFADALPKLRDDIARKGRKFNASGTRFVYQDGAGRSRQGSVTIPTINIGGQTIIDPAGLLFYLQDQIVAFHERELRERDAEGSLPLTERADRIAEIDEALRLADREDCAIVTAARAKGLNVAYRPDAAVFAVLGIERGPNAQIERVKPEYHFDDSAPLGG